MIEKVKQALEGILARFESGTFRRQSPIPLSLSPASRPPSGSSLTDLYFIAGTPGTRGFRQWMEVDRQVKKGSKAFAIIG